MSLSRVRYTSYIIGPIPKYAQGIIVLTETVESEYLYNGRHIRTYKLRIVGGGDAVVTLEIGDASRMKVQTYHFV